MRKLFLSLSLVATGVATFAIMSHASSRPPDLPGAWPAHALPTSSLPDSTRLVVQNLIGSQGAADYGITSDSYSSVRILAHTAAGAIYIVPGTNGACMVLLPVVGCGHPGSDTTNLSVFAPDPSRRYYVGGGIFDRAGRTATLHSGVDGRTGATQSVPGGFVLPVSAGIKNSGTFTMEVR
jgi:hypothetical protein